MGNVVRWSEEQLAAHRQRAAVSTPPRREEKAPESAKAQPLPVAIGAERDRQARGVPKIGVVAHVAVERRADEGMDGDAAGKVYFSSFCMDGDLLEQWRAYAINGKGG